MYVNESSLLGAPRRPERRRGVVLAARAVLVLAAVAALLFVPDARAHRGPAFAHGHTHRHRDGAPRGHAVSLPDQTALGLQWYDLTRAAVAAAALPEQVTQNRVWAVSWIAAARAVEQRRDPAFQTAAFASALHDALVALVPVQAPQLDAALATTLASVPSGAAKTAGIAAGQHAAAQELAARAGDGLDTASVDAPWTPRPRRPASTSRRRRRSVP